MLWWYTWVWVEPRLNYLLHMGADLIEDHGRHMGRWDKDILVSMEIGGWHIADDGEEFMDLDGAHRELMRWSLHLEGTYTWTTCCRWQWFYICCSDVCLMWRSQHHRWWYVVEDDNDFRWRRMLRLQVSVHEGARVDAQAYSGRSPNKYATLWSSTRKRLTVITLEHKLCVRARNL